MSCSVSKFWLSVWVVCWLLPLSFARWYPVRDGVTRGLLIAGTLVMVMGVAAALWRRHWGRAACLAGAVAVAALLLLPARQPDPDALRAEYVRALASYLGTPFVWGGETRRGVDCSGLVRRALVDAMVRQGVKTRNAQLLRAGFALWWRDHSAHDLGAGQRGITRRVLQTPSLNVLAHNRILPGDLAVTGDGLHVLAYLGNHVWIEADPSIRMGDRVVTIRVPTAQSAWFSMPAHIVRWRVLDDAPADRTPRARTPERGPT